MKCSIHARIHKFSTFKHLTRFLQNWRGTIKHLNKSRTSVTRVHFFTSVTRIYLFTSVTRVTTNYLLTSLKTVAMTITRCSISATRCRRLGAILKKRKKIVIQNIETIKKIVNIIFDIIFNNLHNIPIGIKLVCKVIQVLIYRKFGQVNESKVFDIIGRFLFDTYLLP